jgi:hypothetical protein
VAAILAIFLEGIFLPGASHYGVFFTKCD